jgi:hypothetical protein
MGEGPCISVWLRDDVPERYRQFATFYDHEGIEFTVYVAHVPAAVLADRITRQCEEVNGANSYLWWGTGGLFGTNCLDTIPEPSGDGIIVVGGCI